MEIKYAPLRSVKLQCVHNYLANLYLIKYFLLNTVLTFPGHLPALYSGAQFLGSFCGAGKIGRKRDPTDTELTKTVKCLSEGATLLK